jgi:hypothetical protein
MLAETGEENGHAWNDRTLSSTVGIGQIRSTLNPEGGKPVVDTVEKKKDWLDWYKIGMYGNAREREVEGSDFLRESFGRWGGRTDHLQRRG